MAQNPERIGDPRSLNSASPKMGNNGASGAGREGSRGRLLCGFLQLRGPTLPAQRCGEGFGPLKCKQPHKSRPRDPSRPAPGALLFPILWGSTIDGPGVPMAGAYPQHSRPQCPCTWISDLPVGRLYRGLPVRSFQVQVLPARYRTSSCTTGEGRFRTYPTSVNSAFPRMDQ